MFVQMYSLKARNFSSSGTSSSLSFGCGPKLPDQSHVRSLTYHVSCFFSSREYDSPPLQPKKHFLFHKRKNACGFRSQITSFFIATYLAHIIEALLQPPRSFQPLVAISPGNSMLGNSVMSTKPADFRKSMRVGNDGFGGGKNREITGRNEEILGKVLRNTLTLKDFEW